MHEWQLNRTGVRVNTLSKSVSSEVTFPLQSDILDWLSLWRVVPGSARLIEERVICCDPLFLETVHQVWNIEPDADTQTIKQLAKRISEGVQKCTVRLLSDGTSESIALQFEKDIGVVVEECGVSGEEHDKHIGTELSKAQFIRRAVQLLPLSVFGTSKYLSVTHTPVRARIVWTVMCGILISAAAILMATRLSLASVFVYCGIIGLVCGVITAVFARRAQVLVTADGVSLTRSEIAIEMARHVLERRSKLLSTIASE